jgi:MFS family permease
MAASSGPRPSFFVLYAAVLSIGMGNTMLLAVLPPMARELAMPDAFAGAIFSLSALLFVLASPFWGRVSDRRGRPPIIALGLVGFAVSMIGFAAVSAAALEGWIGWGVAFVGMALTRAVFGLVGSAASPVAQAYVADRTGPAERTEELAALSSWFAIGSVVGPAFCALLAAQLGYVAPILAAALFGAGAAVAVRRLLPEGEGERARIEPQSLTPAPTASAWTLARDVRLAPYLIFGCGLSTVAGVLQQTFGFFVMDRLNVSGVDATELAGAGFMVGALALLAAQIGLLPRLRLPPRMLMLVGSALIALGVVVQIFAPTLGALLTSQFLQGIGFGLARPGFSGGASLAVRPLEQGAAAGLVVAANGFGFVISPLLGGVVYASLGHTIPAWICVAVLIAMAAFAWRSRRLKLNADALRQPPIDD